MSVTKTILAISTTWFFIWPHPVMSLRVFELLRGLHFEFAEAIQVILINPSYDDLQELQINKDFQSLQLQVLTYSMLQSFDNMGNRFCGTCGRDYLIVFCHHSIFEIETFLFNISEITFKWKPTVFAVLSNKLLTLSETQLQNEFSSVARKNEFDRNDLIAVNDDSKNGFILYELYRLVTTSMVQKIQLHHIRSIANSDYSLDRIYSQNRRYNLRGDPIRDAFYPYKNARAQASFKMRSDNLNQMSMLLNFSIQTIISDAWISFEANSSRKGIGWMLLNNVADFSVQFSELSINRIKKLDFIFPFNFNREEVFFRQPPSMFENILLQPYKIELWIVFLICFLILTMLSFSLQLQHFLCGRTSIKMKQLDLLGESILWAVSLFTQQGWHESPSRFSSKVLTISGFVLTTSASYVYAASILSIITAREPPIKTFEQLVSSGMEILADSDSQNAQHYVKTDTGDEQDKIVSSYEGLVRILTSPSAFLTYEEYLPIEEIKANNLLKPNDDFCRTISKVVLDSKGLPVYNGMYTKKQSPFRKMLRYASVRMSEVGFTLRAKRFFSLNITLCFTNNEFSNDVGVEPITFSVLAPLFVILLATGMLCLIFLGVEIKIKHDCRNREGRPNFRFLVIDMMKGLRRNE